MRVRIGVSEATKELELDVEDAQPIIDEYEAAFAHDKRLLWVTETDGRRHGIVVDKVLYFELEPTERSMIGFAASNAE